MEAATAAPSLRARVRGARFARETERLRPLGEAYVLRRFGGSLNRADAEDAVAEVLIRLHHLAEEGRPPENLRATFFASVRNQAIDQLRARAVRPTIELDAAGEVAAVGPPLAEWAEGRDDAARLQEALGRMRGNYREAILLRYGLGMTVPEIAEHCEISLPAAKKLVLRATAQARARMEAVEGSEVCPEIREQARRLVLEKHLSGLGEEAEVKLLRAHLTHCGHCKTFLASLHEHLHDLGSAAVLGYAGAERFGHAGVLDGLGSWGASLLDGAHSGGGRIRTLAYKASGALSGSDGAPAGALLTTGQKIAAVCTAGATTATCLLSGAVGPGIVTSSQPSPPERPPAQVREELPVDQATAPVSEALAPAPTPEPAPQPDRNESASAPAPSKPLAPSPEEAEAASPSSEEPRSEFGIEGSPAPVESSPAPPSAARSTGAPSSGSGGGASSPSSSGEAEPAGAGVGFHG